MLPEKPKCPYCGGALEKRPARKKKCPHCSEYIYVRQAELLTEKQVEERAHVNRWMGILERFGVNDQMFAEEGKKLSKQFGFKAPFNDTIWRVINTLVSKQTDPLDLETLYLFMGDFVKEEGRDPTSFVQQAMEVKEASIRREVLRYKRELGGSWKVVIQTCNDEIVCSACKEAASRKYKIDKFLREMPIPGCCENPRGCRCGISVTSVG